MHWHQYRTFRDCVQALKVPPRAQAGIFRTFRDSGTDTQWRCGLEDEWADSGRLSCMLYPATVEALLKFNTDLHAENVQVVTPIYRGDVPETYSEPILFRFPEGGEPSCGPLKILCVLALTGLQFDGTDKQRRVFGAFIRTNLVSHCELFEMCGLPPEVPHTLASIIALRPGRLLTHLAADVSRLQLGAIAPMRELATDDLQQLLQSTLHLVARVCTDDIFPIWEPVIPAELYRKYKNGDEDRRLKIINKLRKENRLHWTIGKT